MGSHRVRHNLSDSAAAVQDEKSSGNWLHNNVNYLTILNCTLKNCQDGKFYVVCIFHNFKKFNQKQKWHLMSLIWKSSCVRARRCHFLVIWSWTSHKTSQYWPWESGEKTWREHLPGMLRGSVMLWTGQSPSRQTAVITTTECSSNPMWSPLESLWKFDTWGYNNSSPQEEEERLLSFPGKGSATEKPWLWKSPPNFLFSSIKVLSSPGTLGT